MTLGKLANLVLRMIGNGQIKVTNITLTQSVIQGYLQVAYGAVVQQIIDKKKKMNELDSSYVLSGAITEKTVDVKNKQGNVFIIDTKDMQMMRVDNAMQIVSFEPVQGECTDIAIDTITYVGPYEKRFYKDSIDYSSLLFYSLAQDSIEIYNLPECITKLKMQYASSDSSIDLPDDICFACVKLALKDMLDLKQIPREKIDDNANEILHQLKLQMSAK